MTQSTAAPAPAASPGAPNDLLARLCAQIEERLRQFREGAVTPAATYALEKELRGAFDAAARVLLEQTLNRLEPACLAEAAPKVRYHRQTYRRNQRTKAEVATTFGPITLWSWLYLAAEDGEPGLHPLHVRLGIGPGGATSLLAERVVSPAGRSSTAKRTCGSGWPPSTACAGRTTASAACYASSAARRSRSGRRRSKSACWVGWPTRSGRVAATGRPWPSAATA